MCPTVTTLIRLHSLTKDGIFDALFSEEIIIKPNSTIAIQSASFIKPNKELVISEVDNEFSFQVGDNGTDAQGLLSVRIPANIYTKDTLWRLLQIVSDRMNKKLSIHRELEHGTQIKMFIDTTEEHHVNFRMWRLGVDKLIEPFNGANADVYWHQHGGITSTLVDDYLYDIESQNPATNSTTLSNYVFYGIPFTAGCGKARMVIRDFDNVNTAVVAGMCIGLVEEEHMIKLVDGTIQLDDFDYYIRTNEDNLSTSKYQSYPEGTLISTPLNVDATADVVADYYDNDLLDIQLSEGKISLLIHKRSGGTMHSQTFSSTEYPYSSENDYTQAKVYYVVIGIFGDISTTTVLGPSFDYDPYSIPVSSSSGIRLKPPIKRVGLTLPPDAQPDTVTSIRNLIFSSPIIASNLGYASVNQNPTLEVSTGGVNDEYRAENSISTFLGTNTFLFELLNLKVTSFDSYNPNYSNNPLAMMGGRRNILSAIMVNESSESQRVYFEPANLIYINLDNKNTLSLRTIRGRLISHDYSPINISGMAEITLLLQQDSDDK
tara:strand:- start:531 stop:2168 length:1638 start_codon:yes stop_codon:yes gene_type:complete